MLKIERFVTELMTSNCYVVYDEGTKRCLVIDPGSEKSQREIEFIEKNTLTLDYIIITHEHTDHNWGVNSLRENFSKSQLVCSEICDKNLKKANRAYFLLYYDDLDYRYEIAPANIVIIQHEESLVWSGHNIKFILTPGHSYGSICIDIDGMLFTGDTIMPYKPYFNGRDSNKECWETSIQSIISMSSGNCIIYPGHGDCLLLKDWNESYSPMILALIKTPLLQQLNCWKAVA